MKIELKKNTPLPEDFPRKAPLFVTLIVISPLSHAMSSFAEPARGAALGDSLLARESEEAKSAAAAASRHAATEQSEAEDFDIDYAFPSRPQRNIDAAKTQRAIPSLARTVCEVNRWLKGCDRIRLKPHASALLLVPDTGLHSFQVARGACEELCQVLTDPMNRDQYGCFEVSGQSYPGYGTYKDVEVESAAQFDREVQQQFTSVVPAGSTAGLMASLPAFREIVLRVFAHMGLGFSDGMASLKFTHFLVQANPHAVFSYHNDARDMRMSRRMMTTIVSLNCNVSGVEILGFKPVWYTGCGEAVAFMGAAIHRSVMPDTYTHKTASCMFAPTKKSSCLSSGVELSKAPVKVALFFD